MKKTLTVNLSGIVFHIDEDAYEMLNGYLADVRRHFSSDESPEIMTDIEARIAELFTDRMKGGRNVVNAEDVGAVISVLGDPGQFGDGETGKDAASDKRDRSARRKSRRYYRDPECALLGGVAAGFAAYAGWDVTLVRILMILLVIVGFGWFIPVYLVIWLITPEAKTAAQRLEMRGEEPTLENIRNYVNGGQFRESAAKMGGVLWNICRTFLKVCFILIGVVMLLVCVAALLGALAVVVLTLLTGGVAFADAVVGFNGSTLLFITAVLSLAFTVIIPLAAITAGCILLVRNKPVRRGSAWPWVALALWIISVTTLVAVYVTKNDELQICGDGGGALLDADAVTGECAVSTFVGISASEGIRVFLEYGDSCGVRVNAPQELMECVKCRVDDGVLRLGMDEICLTPGMALVTVDVVAPHISELRASSAARITVRDTLRVPRLEVGASSAGHIEACVVAGEVEGDFSSASHISLTGKCGLLESEASSAAKCDYAGLDCDSAYVEVTSAANTSVRGAHLDLRATSGGRIRYSGGNGSLVRNAVAGGSIAKMK